MTDSERENLRVATVLREVYTHNGVGSGGIQQMTIAKREGDVITFKEPFFFELQPEHESWYAMETSSADKTTLVAAAPHAALVTRNIIIEPEFQGENQEGSVAEEDVAGRDQYRGPVG